MLIIFCAYFPMNTSKKVVLTDLCCSSPTWDVFLSFYGKDTRSSFTSHLYSALVQAGVSTFKDDPALEKGQQISSALIDAIKGSMIFIVVVSENYARSPWCLNELVQIFSCYRKGIHIVPVFYYVDPSDVRHQKGSFGIALDGHKNRYSADTIEMWKSALSEIAELSGYHLRKEANENESNTIQEIVGNVETWMCAAAVARLEKYVIGKIDALEKSLDGIEPVVEETYQELREEFKIDVLEKSLISKIDVLEKSLDRMESVVEEIFEELMESDEESDDELFSFF